MIISVVCHLGNVFCPRDLGCMPDKGFGFLFLVFFFSCLGNVSIGFCRLNFFGRELERQYILYLMETI